MRFMWLIPNSRKCVRREIVIVTRENPWDVDRQPQSVFCEVFLLLLSVFYCFLRAVLRLTLILYLETGYDLPDRSRPSYLVLVVVLGFLVICLVSVNLGLVSVW